MKAKLASLSARVSQAKLAASMKVHAASVGALTLLLGEAAHAEINANSAATNLTAFMRLLITLLTYALIVCGIASIGYGLMKWRKKGQDNGGDQVEARQIIMPIIAGAAMICLWAVVEFVVTAGGGSSSDIGRTSTPF